MLADVCAVLEITNPSKVKARLNSEDVDSVGTTDAIGRVRPTTVVNESGLYDVVLDSRKPQARTFRRWITSEVVPALRATGQYTVPGHPAAQNTGLTCNFAESRKTPVNGGPARVDYRLDRMAAYLVAMNGDPNKAEVAAGVREAGS